MRAGALRADTQGGVEITGSSFEGNGTSAGCGGAVLHTGAGALSVAESLITGNEAESGAGICVRSSGAEAEITIEQTSVTNNVATDQGGGLFAENVIVRFVDSELVGNRAVGAAGAYLDRSRLLGGTKPSLVASNIAADKAGGIYLLNGELVDLPALAALEIRANEAIEGAGLFATFGRFDVEDLTIEDNVAGFSGGGIQQEFAELRVTGGSVSGNEAEFGLGGGFYLNTDRVADELEVMGVNVAVANLPEDVETSDGLTHTVGPAINVSFSCVVSQCPL